MTIRHLLIFREIARTGNFTKAAKNLFITQSAVSHAVGELEAQAGTALFDRLAKSVILTASGEAFLEEALPLLASWEALESRMGHLEEKSPIRIVSCITIGGFWLPGLLKIFREKCPETPVKVEVASAASALEILEQGKADMAFIEGNVLPDMYQEKRFSSYRLLAAARPGYVKKEQIAMEELLKEPLLLRERGSAIRDTFEGALKAKGYEVEPSWVSVNSQALLEAAKEGMGITIMPEVLLEREFSQGSLEQVKVRGLHLKNNLTAVVHRDKYMSRPLRELWGILGEKKVTL